MSNQSALTAATAVTPFEISTDRHTREDLCAGLYIQGSSLRLNIQELEELDRQARQAVANIQWMRADFAEVCDHSTHHLVRIGNAPTHKEAALCNRKPHDGNWTSMSPVVGLLTNTDRTHDPYCKQCLQHYARQIEEMAFS